MKKKKKVAKKKLSKAPIKKNGFDMSIKDIEAIMENSFTSE